MKNILTKILIPVVLTTIGSGCKSLNFKNIRVHKGNYVYAYGDSTGAKLRSYKVTSKLLGTLKEDIDAVYLKVDADYATSIDKGNATEVTIPSASVGQPIPELRAFSFSSARKYFYSSKEAAFPGQDRTGLRYSQLRPFLQISAIPIKFRGPVGNVTPQVESSVNGALSFGVKYSKNRYTGIKNGLGFTTNSKSIAVGGLIGLNVVDVKSSTTQGKVADANASKNAVVSTGVEVVLGLNNINLGVVVGEDIITGPHRTSWNYFGKPWVGLVIGIDIIK